LSLLTKTMPSPAASSISSNKAASAACLCVVSGPTTLITLFDQVTFEKARTYRAVRHTGRVRLRRMRSGIQLCFGLLGFRNDVSLIAAACPPSLSLRRGGRGKPLPQFRTNTASLQYSCTPFRQCSLWFARCLFSKSFALPDPLNCFKCHFDHLWIGIVQQHFQAVHYAGIANEPEQVGSIPTLVVVFML